jgi:hypothetical protein
VSERLQGLLLILAGGVSLALVHFLQRYLAGSGRLLPPMLAQLEPGPLASPFNCLLGFVALGALGLILVGAKKLLFPDNWRPPVHRD